METEANVIFQAKGGDRSAYCELMRTHRCGVINVVYQICADFQLAEDMAQESFLRAWNKLHNYKPKVPFTN